MRIVCAVVAIKGAPTLTQFVLRAVQESSRSQHQKEYEGGRDKCAVNVWQRGGLCRSPISCVRRLGGVSRLLSGVAGGNIASAPGLRRSHGEPEVGKNGEGRVSDAKKRLSTVRGQGPLPSETVELK